MKTFKLYIENEDIDIDDPDGEKVFRQELKDVPPENYLDDLSDKSKDGKFYSNQGHYIFYRKNGKVYRVIDPSGARYWLKNKIFHREDGPAAIYYDGRKEWWKNGMKHREDGPAVIKPDGEKEWWINNQLYAGKKPFPEDYQLEQVKSDPDVLDVIPNPTKDVQKYIIKEKPSLIGEIEPIDSEIEDNPEYKYIIQAYRSGI